MNQYVTVFLITYGKYTADFKSIYLQTLFVKI